MRRVFNSLVRGVAVVTVIVVVAGNVAAAPRERGATKEKVSPVVKMLKGIVRSLGDGLTVPLPGPRP